MPKQPAFPGLRYAIKKKVTRREQFLAEMGAVVPCGRLLALIAPHYPKAVAEVWAPTDASRDDAAGVFPAELVCVERPDG